MRCRKLRIAFSVACVLACMLLIALRMRSFQTVDDLWLPGLSFESFCGRFTVRQALPRRSEADLLAGRHIPTGRHWLTRPVDRRDGIDWNEWSRQTSPWYFGWPSGGALTVTVPQSSALFLIATLAVIPWIRRTRRFSLRTLLIVTTLVAVVLGAVIYVLK
jgi:hypothetical protein